ILAILLIAFNLWGQTVTISEKTRNMQKSTGFFDYYWDEATGKIWLEIDKFDFEFLYIVSLSAGLGSNDIGLDRAQLGGTKIVEFQRIGPKLLLVQPNYSFRANSDNNFEIRAVEDAFARSVIWGFKIEAEENERVLVDASDFLLRDGHGVIQTLKNSNQGTYKFDTSKSAFYLPRTKNFPLNTEFEVITTFTGETGGNFVRSVSPDPGSISVRQHYSFVQLPDDNFESREFDPRSGISGTSYLDYATEIDEPLTKRFANRHRISKKNPDAAVSEPVESIVYYVDNGTPEPIRTALVEGARWWDQAFEAAGYKDAFKVEILPGDADPMDLRYNVINWVHRSTRGWSYGSSVVDPRTGEIIKGHVTLGSLRVRQDFLIAEGLLSPYEDGAPSNTQMHDMALSRIRQLSCHEVGHTLGFNHNYMSSTQNRSSVMDYPHPLVKIAADGSIDLSDAYTESIGEWDKVMVAWAYQDFPDNAIEKNELNKILSDAAAAGLSYVTDQDARSPGSAHPYNHLWDNGENAVDELLRVIQIRKLALENFSENNIKPDFPLAALEEVLVPVYLFHRFQVEAASKVIGGAEYYYSMRGDWNKPMNLVPPAEQRRALDAVLETISPDFLTLDERIINLILPRPPGFGQTPELFQGRTGPTFDPVEAAETAAGMVVPFILNPERAARLIEYHSRTPEYPGLGEIIDKLINFTWKSNRKSDLKGVIQRTVDNAVLNGLMDLAANSGASSQVRAISWLKLDELRKWISNSSETMVDENQKAHLLFSKVMIEQFQRDPSKRLITQPLPTPAGSPIGIKH
ncbi:zinc-dependent metalloprotease, partial [candidate division KSB1 bacterium]